MSHIAEGNLHAYLDGAVLPDTPEYGDIQAHLALCSDCRVRLDEAAELRAEAQEALSELRTGGVTAPPFQEVVRMASPEPPRRSPTRRRLPVTIAAAAIVVLAFGLGWMGRDAANLLRPARETAMSERKTAFADRGAPEAGDSAQLGGVAGPTEPRSGPTTATTSGTGRASIDDAPESESVAEPAAPRVALARPSLGHLPSVSAPLRSIEPLPREGRADREEAGADARGEDVAVPERYGLEVVDEGGIAPDLDRPRRTPVFPWRRAGERPGSARTSLALRDEVGVPSGGEERERSDRSRERAELRLGSPLVVVSGLPLPTVWDRLEGADRRVRTTQVMPGGTLLELTQWRTGEARQPVTDQQSIAAIDATLPLAPRVLRQGETDDGRSFIHVELWSGQAVLAIASPLPPHALLPLVARLEALR